MTEPLDLDAIYYGDGQTKETTLQWTEAEGVPTVVTSVKVGDLELGVTLNLKEPYIHSDYIALCALIAEVKRLREELSHVTTITVGAHMYAHGPETIIERRDRNGPLIE